MAGMTVISEAGLTAQQIVDPHVPTALTQIREMWRDALPQHERQLFDEIYAVTYDRNLSEPQRAIAFETTLNGWNIGTQTMAAEVWHKWTDIQRVMHEMAHRNGVNKRLGNEDEKPPGQTVRGALLRALDLIKVRGGVGKQLQELHEKVFNHRWFVQSTPHPTNTTDRDYAGTIQALRHVLGEFARHGHPEELGMVRVAIQKIANHKKVIRMEKRTDLEEIEESFDFVANGLYGSANAAYKLREAIRDELSGASGHYSTKSLDFYMIALMGDWNWGDADGNPARLASSMKTGIDGDFERIRGWIADELEIIKKDIRIDAPLDRIIARLTCDATDEKAFSRLSDADGLALAEALKEASKNQEGSARVELQKLSAIMKKSGWFWRRGDIRQSPEIHAELAGMIDQGMDWAALKDKVTALHSAATTEKDKLKYFVFGETLARLDVAREYPDAVRQYIISNYSGAEDARNLLRLMRLAGIQKGLQLCFLHETATDLMNAPDYLADLCNDAEFGTYLQDNNHRITIKIAMSDTQRESGPAAYFLQMHAPIETMLKLMDINRDRKQRGLQPIEMDLQFGGSDDMVRGGNDNTNYLQEFVRNLKGAACLNGFSQDEIREALGPNFNATNQGRQRVTTLGDQRSAERTMERHAAMVIGAAAFLQHDHEENEMREFQKEYLANCEAKEAVVELMIPYYKAFRGEMRNALGDLLTSAKEVSLQNDGCRPDTRPGARQNWTETRAITNDIADQLSGLRLTGWFGIHRLRELGTEKLQRLYANSPQFRDWSLRAEIVLASVQPARAWRAAGLEELKPCCMQQKKHYADAFEPELVARAAGGIGTRPMEESEYNWIMGKVLRSAKVEDTPENTGMMMLSAMEYQMHAAVGTLVLAQSGMDLDVCASAVRALKHMPSENGKRKYARSATARIADEIIDQTRAGEFFAAILATPGMRENRRVFHQRPDEFTPKDWLQKVSGSGIFTSYQTPASFLDRSAADNEMHISQSMDKALGQGRNAQTALTRGQRLRVIHTVASPAVIP